MALAMPQPTHLVTAFIATAPRGLQKEDSNALADQMPLETEYGRPAPRNDRRSQEFPRRISRGDLVFRADLHRRQQERDRQPAADRVSRPPCCAGLYQCRSLN